MQRNHTTDTLRGIAIILMIIDHVLAIHQTRAGTAIRFTITRASMPLFMYTAGSLWKTQTTYTRLTAICVAAAWATLCETIIGFHLPEILTMYLPCYLLSPLIVNHPRTAATIGIIQATEWTIHWGAYQPGTILALCALGTLGGQMPSKQGPKAIEAIGRNPLRWYSAHLTALALWRLIA